MADFYQILGVSRDADADTLKRAYRKLARQYHPDVNKEPGAEDKFKEIGKAYEALADPETRARYDQFGEAGLGGAAGMPDLGDLGGFADLFETFFNGFGGQNPQGGRTQIRGPQQGDDLSYDLNVDFKDAIFGQEFDPNLHEAVLREPSEEFKEDFIVEELQRGYHLEGKVLRHALVKVSMGPGKQNSQEEVEKDTVEVDIDSEENTSEDV